MIDEVLQSLRYHLEARNLSEHTIHQYETSLRRFYAWRGDLANVTPAVVEEYLASLRSAGLASVTLRWHFAGLQGFFKWHARREDYANPTLGMEPPRIQERPKDVVGLADMRRVLVLLDRRKRYRDAALISLLLESGLRISEALSLNWSDIDWRQREARLPQTKNREAGEVPFLAGTGERLDLWRSKRRDKSAPYVFPGRNGRLTRSGALQLVKKAFAEIGLPAISPHDLRHSFATAYMDANPEGEAVLKVIGRWKSDTMVRRYSKKGREARAKAAFRESSPMNRL